MVREGRISYNENTGRYGFLIGDLWQNGDGFHCGEPLEVMVDGEWVGCVMEKDLDGVWYLKGTGLKGDDLEYLRARLRARNISR